MFRNKSVEAYNCGEPGDLYAWKVEPRNSWRIEASTLPVKLTGQNKQVVCAKKESNIFPRKSINESLKYCSAITGRNILQADQRDFIEIIRQPSGPKYCWLPLKNEVDEERFNNKYASSSFEISLLASGKPSTGEKLNLLFWRYYENGAFDDNEMYKYNSLCEHDIQPKSLKLRGLCSLSNFDKEYHPTMQVEYRTHTLVWRGISNKNATFMCMEVGTYSYCMWVNLIGDSSIGKIPNLESSVEPFGKRRWEMLSDNKGCSTENFYNRTVSLR